MEIEPGCQSGLFLFYDPVHMTGILIDSDGIGARLGTGFIPSRYEKGATRATLRIVNDHQEVDFYYRVPGKAWQRTQESAEISGMQHNVLGGFLDVRPALFRAAPAKLPCEISITGRSQIAIMRPGQLLLFVLCFIASLSAQPRSQLDLGHLQSGAIVSFIRSTSGEWGIEIAGGPAPRISQPKPARLEVSPTEEETRELVAGYKTVRKSAEGVDALAEIRYGENVVFRYSGPLVAERIGAFGTQDD